MYVCMYACMHACCICALRVFKMCFFTEDVTLHNNIHIHTCMHAYIHA